MGNNNKPLPTTTAQLPRSFAPAPVGRNLLSSPLIFSVFRITQPRCPGKLTSTQASLAPATSTRPPSSAPLATASGQPRPASTWPVPRTAAFTRDLAAPVSPLPRPSKPSSWATTRTVPSPETLPRPSSRLPTTSSARATKQATGQVAEGRLQEDRRAHSRPPPTWQGLAWEDG